MDRHQVMESNTGTSRPAHIQSGVPQGSILGPTLVLMFLNDLHPYMKHCDSDYYADDATVHTHGNTPIGLSPSDSKMAIIQSFGENKIKRK